MFVLWRSIDEKMDSHQSNNSKRKHKVRIDCSASSAGLFAGVLFLICSLVSIGIYTIFSQVSKFLNLAIHQCCFTVYLKTNKLEITVFYD